MTLTEIAKQACLVAKQQNWQLNGEIHLLGRGIAQRTQSSMKREIHKMNPPENLQLEIPEDSKYIKFQITCPQCGKVSELRVLKEHYLNWRYKGMLIQTAMPELTPPQRELLLSGICPKCWTEIQ